MEPSGQVSSGLDGELDGENCLKEIANNYIEDEDVDNSSGDEAGVARENGIAFSRHTGHGRDGRRVLVENGTEDCRDNADDSASDGDRIEVSDDSSGEEDSGESSGKDGEQDGDDEDDEGEEEEKEVGERGGNHGTPALRRGETCITDNVFMNNSSREHGKLVSNERLPTAAEGMPVEKEEVDTADDIQNGLEVPEKGLTESESGPQTGGTQVGPALRRRRGRPLKSSDRKSNIRAAPITPKLEEPRVVRVNRGVKRRFPGITLFPGPPDHYLNTSPLRAFLTLFAMPIGSFYSI